MQEKNLLKKMMKNSGEAVKSFLGFNSTSPIHPGTYGQGTPFGKSGWLFDTPAVGTDTFFSYGGLNDIIRAYEYCPPIYSIINKQAYAVTNGKFWILDKDGNESESEYSKKIRKLFAKPNALQNGKQFEAQYSIYLRLFGYCVILPIKPVGYPIEDSKSFWIIPPYMCEFEFSKETYFNLKNGFIKNIKVKYGQEETNLTPENVIILRDITPGFDNMFLPSSPIKPLQQNINNLIGIYNSKGTLINYRGSLGILTPEIDPAGAIAMEPGEVEEMQNGLMQYGLRSGQRKFIVANAAMKWQQMGIPYRDLMLTEWGEDDTMVVCDGLNYPFKLLANTKSSSMNGTEVESFKKILYQDFVIPFSEMIDQQWNEYLNTEENNCRIEKDFSHVAVLQEDDVKKATARLMLNQALKIEYETGLITINQWLVKLGEDPIGELGDTRATDIKDSSVPLASIIGVGGVQSLIGVLTAAGISEEARAATLQILFGITPENAIAMTQGSTSTTETATQN